MNIVHINTTDNRGGAAQIAHLLHSQLQDIVGINSKMLVREKNTRDDSIGIFGVQGWRRWLSILFSSNQKFIGGNDLLNHPWIKEADIIHLHNTHGYYFHLPIIKELSKTKKVIWTLHDMWTMTNHCGTSLCEKPNSNGMYTCKNQFEYEPILLPIGEILGEQKRSILSNLTIQYVTPSQFMLNKFKKSYLKNHDCICIPNGLDTEIFLNQKNMKNDFKKELGLPSNKKIILFIANSFKDPVKGRDTLIKVLSEKRLEEVQFIAIGNGNLPQQKNLLQIPYTKDKKILAKYYTCADIYIHPAIADNFPTVIVESLLSGTPIVAYDVGGIKEQIRDTTDGRIVEKGGWENFIKAILETLQRTLNPEDISSRALEEFSVNKMVQNYLYTYNK